jgi:serine/threonine-protein kinase
MSEITERLKAAIADRYVIERELGQGGMATVYLAHDVKHDRKVGLKVLRPELAAVLGAERFVQEIKTTASLQHPHILPLFDSGQAEGFLYYVMPYVEGETLRDKLNRETQLGIDEAVRITTEVADALDYAHRHNVIHRDIKPENVLLHDGRPMVADFGIALAVSAAAGGRMTETGLSLGTPHYMSPEQATAEKDLTNRSDIYSLGSVLYEMLTGNPPHTGASAQQIIMKIVTEEPAPVTSVRKSVPPNVTAAVAKALEKLPADRFESASKFAEALREPSFMAATVGTVAGRAGPTSDWRQRWAVPFAVLAAASLVTAVWLSLRPRGETLPVIRYTMAFPAGEELYRTFGTSLALSPDGSLLAYASATERGSQLRVRARDELTSQAIPGTDGIWQPFFSPDGRRVAFITESRKLTVVSLIGEPALVIADSGLWRNGGSWGRDGYLYVGWQQHGTVLSRIPAEGGLAEPITVLDAVRGEVSHAWPDALPSERGLLFTAMRHTNQTSETDEVVVIDLRTGEQRSLVQGIFGRYLAGYLVFVRYDGTFLAAPFDQDALVLTGPAVPLLSGVPVEPGPDLALSASGRLAYATSGLGGGPSEIVWLDRTGIASAVEDDWTITPASGSPVLSPDGTQLAVSVQEGDGSDIWIKDLNGGTFTRLTFDGNSILPAWSPDGTSVLYRSVQPGLSYDLFTKPADNTGPAEVLLDPEIEVLTGLWSGDGQWLVVMTVGGDLYSYRPDTDSVPMPLLNDEFNESAPALSPNGRWLAYVSDESGRPEVYVRSFPNVAATRQQVSTAGGVEPRWAHSGRELFYKSPAREFIAVMVRAEQDFTVVGREALFAPDAPLDNDIRIPQYDVSPDDRRFLTFRRIGSRQGPGTAIVIESFLAELKAKGQR